MAFYPCSNSVPTETYSISRNGTYDMGQTHKYRYVAANVLPSGGMSCIYRGEFPRSKSGANSASVTFNGANNYQYAVHFRYVSSDKSLGWGGASALAFGGSARYWTHTGVSGQSNVGGHCAYTGSTCAFVIGNGSNVSVTWNYNSSFDCAIIIEIYQINW